MTNPLPLCQHAWWLRWLNNWLRFRRVGFAQKLWDWRWQQWLSRYCLVPNGTYKIRKLWFLDSYCNKLWSLLCIWQTSWCWSTDLLPVSIHFGTDWTSDVTTVDPNDSAWTASTILRVLSLLVFDFGAVLGSCSPLATAALSSLDGLFFLPPLSFPGIQHHMQMRFAQTAQGSAAQSKRSSGRKNSEGAPMAGETEKGKNRRRNKREKSLRLMTRCFCGARPFSTAWAKVVKGILP